MMRRPSLLLTLAICDARVLDALAADLVPEGPAGRPMPRPAPVAVRRQGRPLAMLLLFSLGLCGLSMAASFEQTARNFVQAVQRQDPGQLEALVDWQHLRHRLGQELAPVGGQPDWLASMGREVADRMATAHGLLPVLQARLGSRAGSAEARLLWPGIARPLGPQVGIGLGGQRQVVLTLSPRGPWSWQVVDVELPGPAEAGEATD